MDTIKFISALEGYHTCCKIIHWTTDNKAEHELINDIDKDILSFEDRYAEAVIGAGIKINFQEMKTLLPKSKTTSEMLDELLFDVSKLKEKISHEQNVIIDGLQNILDEFVEKILYWKFLEKLK